ISKTPDPVEPIWKRASALDRNCPFREIIAIQRYRDLFPGKAREQYILWIYRYDSQPYRNNVAGIGSASTDTHPVAFSRPTISPTSGSFTQPNLNKVQHDRITNAYGSISPVSSL